MTPLTLVLLVGLSAATPASSAPAAPEAAALEAVMVIIGGRNDIRIGGRIVKLERVGDTLLALHDGDRNARILVKGLESAAYGDVMDVLRAIEAAGFHQIALVAEEVR